MTLRVPVWGVVLALTVVVAACTAGAGSSASTGSPDEPGTSASIGLEGPILTPEEAFAKVVAVDPRFAGIEPLDPEMIGQARWYDAAPIDGGGYEVLIGIGWGDCPSGCIEEHVWTYLVATDGTVTLTDEGGDPVPSDAFPQPGS